jgi:hypothetical protein
VDLERLGGPALAAVALLVVAIVVFGFAVWFGLRVIAPRIGRVLDHADIEDDEGDGDD